MSVRRGFLHHRESGALQYAPHDSLGRYFGHQFITLMNPSGHRHFDLQAYSDYFAGKLVDQDFDPKALEASLSHLPKVAAE
jgi:hypothetical protein